MLQVWAGKEDWMIARNYKFITNILILMRRPTEHRHTKNKDKEKRLKQKSQFIRVMKDLLYNFAETAMWHACGSTANLPKEQSTKRQMVEEGSCQADLEY